MAKEFTEPTRLIPDWGPYSKKYMGISKVVRGTAPIDGARFDLTVHPMAANTNQPAPNVTVPSNYHVWEAAPDLSWFSYRVEMEWKDQLYADVSFARVNDHLTVVRTEYVNNTDLDQICVLNYYLAMEYRTKSQTEAVCDGNYVLKNMTDFDAMEYAIPRPWDHEMPDGLHRGEFFDEDFLNGTGLGERSLCMEMEHIKRQPFGRGNGDFVTLSLTADQDYDTLLLRYRTTDQVPVVFSLTLQGKEYTEEQEISFPVSSELSALSLPVSVSAGEILTFTLTSEGTGGIEFDFAALCCSETPVTVQKKVPDFTPKLQQKENSWLLNYDGVEEQYCFRMLTDSVRVRSINSGCIEDALVSRLSQGDPTFDEVTKTFTSAFKEKHSDDGFYQNFIVHSLFITAGEHHVEFAIIGDTANDEIPLLMAQADPAWAENICKERRDNVIPMNYNEDGKDYEFSNRLLKATLLTNIVYPIYRHGTWIKHHTPGKRWDSLYTWDSGFIGLGLLDEEPGLAEYILDLYLSTPENHDFAFLHHGSPVPVQVYLYLELLQRSADKTRLYIWYPAMKRYYEFLAGKTDGSATDPFKSRMTTTFDYFYNCSGMDDLPPQVAMYQRGLKYDCAPALTTSQLIRMAKILRMIAIGQGFSEDVNIYDEDIRLRTDALQTWSWDAESGYFAYVVHDKERNPIGILRTENGENLSKGMDGIYPIVAGACTPSQETRLLDHIFNKKEMFSKVGISAVDMSASYYQPNGYWNGNVWFSHQWFIWKTMFDLGKAEEAYQIAKVALDSWKKEVNHSYYTFEMLNIATSRGGWFHQFGGLSSPINIWANAYYRPGTVTCGFDLWIEDQKYDEHENRYVIKATRYSDHEMVLVAVLQPSEKISVTINEAPARFNLRTAGAVEVILPAEIRQMEIMIEG